MQPDGGAGDAPDGGGSGDAHAAGLLAVGSLADVLRMLERLPLTDAEKADAVRRLLADRSADGVR